MRQYYKHQEDEQLNFAHEAAKHFEEYLTDVTYLKTMPEKGGLMALRWGIGCDCVVVFRISETEEVVNYCQFIDKEKARKTLKIFDEERKKEITESINHTLGFKE